jgi:hypothetical protein
MNIRRPAVAGRSYPGNPTSLAVAKRHAPLEPTRIRHGSRHDEDMSEIFRLGVAGPIVGHRRPMGIAIGSLVCRIAAQVPCIT